MVDLEHHVPSLTHLRRFARARSKGRPPRVLQDRRQVLAPKTERFGAFAYEKFLTAVIAYIDSGCRGGALARAVDEASQRMRPSYEVSARGLVPILDELQPIAAKRHQRSVLVPSDDDPHTSVRVHLVLTLPDKARVGTFFHFPGERLTDIEIDLMDTAVLLAAHRHGADFAAVISPRSGELRFIQERAASTQALSLLREVALDYAHEWHAAGEEE